MGNTLKIVMDFLYSKTVLRQGLSLGRSGSGPRWQLPFGLPQQWQLLCPGIGGTLCFGAQWRLLPQRLLFQLGLLLVEQVLF